MAFQKGNKLAAKSGQFGHELQKAIAQGDPEKLRRIAEKLLSLAEAGDLAAIREVADRLDGKAVQTVNATVEHTVDVGSSDTFADKIERALQQRAPVTVQ
jgi:ribosomal protein L17